jgi:hypothetical protein
LDPGVADVYSIKEGHHVYNEEDRVYIFNGPELVNDSDENDFSAIWLAMLDLQRSIFQRRRRSARASIKSSGDVGSKEETFSRSVTGVRFAMWKDSVDFLASDMVNENEKVK